MVGGSALGSHPVGTGRHLNAGHAHVATHRCSSSETRPAGSRVHPGDALFWYLTSDSCVDDRFTQWRAVCDIISRSSFRRRRSSAAIGFLDGLASFFFFPGREAGLELWSLSLRAGVLICQWVRVPGGARRGDGRMRKGELFVSTKSKGEVAHACCRVGRVRFFSVQYLPTRAASGWE